MTDKKTTSKALIDEDPILFLPTLAVAVGVNEAIFLQQIHYWTKINEKAKRNKKQGFYWTYNTYEDWREYFPFWSSKTIQRIVKGLATANLLVVGCFNTMKLDQTRWYRINYKNLETLVSELVSGIGLDKVSTSIRSTCPNGEIVVLPTKPHFYVRGSHGKTGRQLKAAHDMAAIENRERNTNDLDAINTQGATP